MGRPSWKKRNNSWMRLILLLFLMALLTGIVVTLMIEVFLRPTFLAMAEERATQMATEAINQAVYENAKDLKYTDLIHYQTNHKGDIILMQPDLQKANRFISKVNMDIQKRIKSFEEEELRLPIAQSLGIQILAGVGPRVPVHMVPVGLVKPPQIIDSFESAGINQTRHKIYMQIEAEVKVVVPFIHNKIKVNTQVPVTEVTIMGKVPDVYVGIDGGLIKTKND